MVLGAAGESLGRHDGGGDGDVAAPPELVVGEADGVRTIHLARPHQGDVTATLTFRVGTGDEPVASRGITHLVEHLALTTFQSDRLHWNGQVNLSRTDFYAHGPRDEVVRFLNEVTRNLRSLPEGRVFHERRVLQVESRSREWSIFDAVLTTRYGLKGPGQGVVREWGLEWLQVADLQAWVDKWFTGANAVLSSTAPLAGLELALATGSARPPTLPAPNPRLPVAEGRTLGMILLSSVVKRSTASAAAARLLDRRLRRRLRHETGVSYSPAANYGPLTADLALVTASADVHSDHCEQATAGALAVLNSLAVDGPTEEELREDRLDMAVSFGREGVDVAWMDRVALAYLFGEPDPQNSSFVDELKALTPEEVAAAAASMRDQAVLVVPECSIDLVGLPFSKGAAGVAVPVNGETIRWRYAPMLSAPRLVVGSEGVTHWDWSGEPTTVRFDRCAGVVAWRDGTCLLYGTDGGVVYLDADEWRGFERVRAIVNRHAPVPQARVYRDPERDPHQARNARRWATRRLAGKWLPAAVGAVLAIVAFAVVVAGGVHGLGDVWRRAVVIATGAYLAQLWFQSRSADDASASQTT